MPIKVEGFSGGDRTDIKLPSTQESFIKKVAATNKPVVLVLMGGSAITFNYADAHIPAILHSWYPGELGGKAITDILFGLVNPSGKLPVTFYKSMNDLPDFEDYRMHNRTYKYFEGEPLYPFGHGLSYTHFAYSDLEVSEKELNKINNITVKVKVTNAGKFPGAEVIQLYLSDMVASVRVPKISLEGFDKIELNPGEQKEITFTLTPEQLAIINEKGEKIVEPGSFIVYVGGKQPKMKGNADNPTTEVLSEIIKYTGPFISL
jgi:beta-glucosidase